ncbi:MAG: hypothetical protein QXZ09_08670 [Candidatus Methanomethylicaceae archaeon]
MSNDPSYGPIWGDLGFNVAQAEAEDAWRRWVAQAQAQAGFTEAELKRAEKLFKADEARDIRRFTGQQAGRQLYFSGITAEGIGQIQAEYARLWGDFLNDVANRYSQLAFTGWDTNAAMTKNIVDAALDYLARVERVVV